MNQLLIYRHWGVHQRRITHYCQCVLNVFSCSSSFWSVMALKCYKCTGTEDDCAKSTLQNNQNKYLKECPLAADKCFRTFLEKDGTTSVNNDCTNQWGCDLAQSVCDNYAGDITCKVGCCDEDACNVGSHVSFNVILLSVCSALGLTLLM